MKGLNINLSSCTSQNSSAILSSTMESPSSPPSSYSSSSSSPFSTFTPGSRAIDRHNPIITDEKRSGSNNCTNTPLRTPCTNNVLQQKPTTPISVVNTPNSQSTPKRKSNKLATLAKKTTTTTTTNSSNKKNNAASKPPLSPSNNDITIDGDDDDTNNDHGRRSFSKPSDLIMKASACTNTRPGVDYISPPESSRYLLDDTSFLQVFSSDFVPVLKLLPIDSKNVINKNNNDTNDNGFEDGNKFEGSETPKPSSSSESSDQVVVLRVSLHCRGCEKKMKKHLSRMPGVTSFNIDFAAKKVTVVGDVTPLGVLASISKVKTAKLWTPPAISASSQLNYSSRSKHAV